MKKTVGLFIVSVAFTSVVFAQPATDLYQTARKYMMQGDLENANTSFTNLLKQDPNNLEAQTDYCYLLTLKNDYKKAILIGKQLVANPKATVQIYQTLGLAFKGKEDYSSAENLFKDGIAKFPNSGILYNEYGELYAMQNKLDKAIIQWEAGIKADPNYSSNYYNAAMYYSKVQIDLFWVIQYGEIFVNLESYSQHTATIKIKLFDAYKKLFAGNQIETLGNSATNSPFQKAWYLLISPNTSALKNGVDAESLGALRIRFVLNWFYTKQNEKTPFFLFDHLQYLIKEGLFDAYNQWLFGEVSNTEYNQIWLNTHANEMSFFKAYQQSKLYKQPSGQYYK